MKRKPLEYFENFWMTDLREEIDFVNVVFEMKFEFEGISVKFEN